MDFVHHLATDEGLLASQVMNLNLNLPGVDCVGLTQQDGGSASTAAGVPGRALAGIGGGLGNGIWGLPGTSGFGGLIVPATTTTIATDDHLTRSTSSAATDVEEILDELDPNDIDHHLLYPPRHRRLQSLCKLSNSQSCTTTASPFKNTATTTTTTTLNGNSAPFVAGSSTTVPPTGLFLSSSTATAATTTKNMALQYFSNLLPLSAAPVLSAKNNKSEHPHTTTRLMLPAWSAGRIIGRGGEVINGIRELSGAHITILQSGTDNRSVQFRMVSVSGSLASVGLAVQLIGSQAGAFDDDLPAHQQLLTFRGGQHHHHHHHSLRQQQQHLYGGGNGSEGLHGEGGGTTGGDGLFDEDNMDDPGLRMLIGGGLVGQLLGRRGHRIQEMRMQTGVRRIQVLNVEESRQEGSIRNERIVIIMGTADQCRKAHQLICMNLECYPAQLKEGEREQQRGGGGGAGLAATAAAAAAYDVNSVRLSEHVLSAFLGRDKAAAVMTAKGDNKEEEQGEETVVIAAGEKKQQHDTEAEGNDKGEEPKDKEVEEEEEEDKEFVDAISNPTDVAKGRRAPPSSSEADTSSSDSYSPGDSSSTDEERHRSSSSTSNNSHDEDAEFSSEMVVRISNENMGKLIGKDGCVIRRIRAESRCRIEIDNCPPTREFTIREVRIRGHIQYTHVAARKIAQQMFSGGGANAIQGNRGEKE